MSWFRRLRAESRRVTDFEHALAAVQHALETQASFATPTPSQSIESIAASLQPVRNAVVRVGAVLVVKIDGVLVVHQLTPVQQWRLDHEPHLLRSPPSEILQVLSVPTEEVAATAIAHASPGDESTHEDQDDLDSRQEHSKVPTGIDPAYMAAGINRATMTLDYFLNILGPPPEASSIRNLPDPIDPVGVS